MAQMNVTLPPDMNEFVEKEVQDGGFESSSEVVREALRLLQRDRALELERLEILRHEIGIGTRAAAEGRFSTRSVSDIAEEILRESGQA